MRFVYVGCGPQGENKQCAEILLKSIDNTSFFLFADNGFLTDIRYILKSHRPGLDSIVTVRSKLKFRTLWMNFIFF